MLCKIIVLSVNHQRIVQINTLLPLKFESNIIFENMKHLWLPVLFLK